MNQRTVIVMAGLVLLGVFTLLVLNLAPKGVPSVTAAGVPPTEVRGMAVVHKGIPYTLNFDQQQLANDAIFRAVEVKKIDYKQAKAPFSFDKIMIYRFNAPDVEAFPIQLSDKNLVFSVPAMNEKSYYMELSGGDLLQMINNSFDP